MKLLSENLEKNFNQGDYEGMVKRSNYDLIKGASSIEVNRLLSHFIPVLEELNKNEDIRRRLLSMHWSVSLKQANRNKSQWKCTYVYNLAGSSAGFSSAGAAGAAGASGAALGFSSAGLSFFLPFLLRFEFLFGFASAGASGAAAGASAGFSSAGFSAFTAGLLFVLRMILRRNCFLGFSSEPSTLTSAPSAGFASVFC